MDFDHQFIETEKYDAKMTYKKFTGYSPGVAVIGDLIVGIENCGSCSREIVETIERHSEHFYIRANRCASLYDSLLALRGLKKEEINGIEYELNSITIEKWEGDIHLYMYM